MNIKEEFYKVEHNEITNEYIEIIKEKKKTLSNNDKRFLLKVIEGFKEQHIDETLKAIKIYSIWEPNEAIYYARKKGVFRYKAYKFKKNNALYLLKSLIKDKNIYSFSDETVRFLIDKEKLNFIFDFYKTGEENLIKMIRGYKSIVIKRGNKICKTAIFKDLLAYIDTYFYTDSRSNLHREIYNKNKLDSYSKESISEAISYIVYLYDDIIGIEDDKMYFVNSKYVLSDEIEKIILLACKINEIQEWEVCVDYFNYKISVNNNEWIIFDESEVLEKSIRLGYLKDTMQAGAMYSILDNELKEALSIMQVGDYIEKELGAIITKEISDGQLSRYRFEFPEPLFLMFEKDEIFYDKWFKEEILTIQHCAKELIMSYNEVLNKRITNNCTLIDIITFQRLFLVLNAIVSKILFEKKDKNKAITSLIPLMRKEVLISLLKKFMNDTKKVEELLELFTYKKGIKLDLQYTPFLLSSSGIIFSNTLVARSNLARNAIAYSHLCKNQIVNNDYGLEPLVKVCSEAFKSCDENYQVYSNLQFKYNGKKGEIDVLVIYDNCIILIECKCPLNPVNNFEMRSSLEHIEKANKQLNLSKMAFNDKSFRKNYLKGLGIDDKNREIKTCVIFGNRLFTGYDKYEHPIRYIHELNMLLNNGVIYSQLGEWKVWRGERFSHDDLLDFLSEDSSYTKFNLDSMEKIYKSMYVKGKNVKFETYACNIVKVLEKYDSNFKIISSNNELKKRIRMGNVFKNEWNIGN